MKIDEQEFRMFLVPAVCPERMIAKTLVKSDTVITVWFPGEVNENNNSEFRWTLLVDMIDFVYINLCCLTIRLLSNRWRPGKKSLWYGSPKFAILMFGWKARYPRSMRKSVIFLCSSCSCVFLPLSCMLLFIYVWPAPSLSNRVWTSFFFILVIPTIGYTVKWSLG